MANGKSVNLQVVMRKLETLENRVKVLEKSLSQESYPLAAVSEGVLKKIWSNKKDDIWATYL